MILKRSDKLIAIIGVIILIVAGIGIFVYISGEDDSDVDDDNVNENTFLVEWIQEERSLSLSGYSGRDTTYSETITSSVFKEPVSVLLNVELRVVWEDSQVSGRFLSRLGPFKVGQDSLSAEFTYDGETKMIPKHSNSGNKSEIFTIYDKPADQLLEDVDYNEAIQMITQDYMDMDSASIDVTVMVDPGEKILTFGFFSIIRWLRDKGETFDLEITYTYCYPVINPVNDDNEEEPPTELNPSGDRFSYSKMCLPGML